MTLDECRRQIDLIDRQIAALFEQRMRAVETVTQIKKHESIQITDNNREKIVMENALGCINNPVYKKYAEELFGLLIEISKREQRKSLESSVINAAEGLVGHQGVPGAFSEQALIEFFGEDQKTACFDTFKDVFKALEEGRIQYGVLPIENSYTGSILDVYDLMLNYGFYIAGEKKIFIEHNLLGIKGAQISDIKTVLSHEQAIAQCDAFIKCNGLAAKAVSNTAAAAKTVSEAGSLHIAAIAGKSAAHNYGLEILAEAINDKADNYTRFIIVSKEQKAFRAPEKASIAFTLDNKPGTLVGFLNCFANGGVNLTKIESRPLKSRQWEYIFYADFEGDMQSEKAETAFDLAKQKANMFRILGMY